MIQNVLTIEITDALGSAINFSLSMEVLLLDASKLSLNWEFIFDDFGVLQNVHQRDYIV